MFGRKKKVVKSEPDVVRHNKAYPVMTVNIDEMNADDESFRNWIHSAGITSITIRSPFDPYERKDMGLPGQGDNISHESYDMMSAEINAELSNIMFRIIGSRYRTSILVNNGYWVRANYVSPSFRIDHDEYILRSMVHAKPDNNNGFDYWLSQCDDAPGNDALDVFERTELGKAMTWFMEASPEERKTYADIITWVGPDVKPVAFLTGSGKNVAPARLIERAEDYMRHIHASRAGIPEATPDDIADIADGYVANAESAMTMMREPKPAGNADWNAIVDVIDKAMSDMDALVFATSTMTMENENRRLRLALVDTIRDIELMSSEHEQRGRAVIDSALATGGEREHVR
jgi:hypothetical protein